MKRISHRFAKDKYLRLQQTEVIYRESILLEQPSTSRPLINIPNLTEQMNKYKYLPLEIFEDSTNEKYSNEALYRRIEVDGPLEAQILTEIRGEYIFVYGEIVDYNFVKETFRYAQHGTTGSCSRIYFFCNFESAQTYEIKLNKALHSRALMNSCLRYNYYIDNMPTKDVIGMPESQIARILKLVKSKTSISAAKQHYKRIQNKLQFDKYLADNRDDILSQQIVFEKEIKIVPEYGKVQLKFDECLSVIRDESIVEKVSFRSIQKQFAESTLFNHKEIITILEFVSNINEQIQAMQLFYTLDVPYYVDLMNQKQEQLFKKTLYQIKGWPQQIVEVFTKETKLKQLPNDKIKRVFKLIRAKMQETLSTLMSNNFQEFNKYLTKHIPTQVNIINSSTVINNHANTRTNQNHLYYIQITDVNNNIAYSYDIRKLQTYWISFMDIVFQELSKVDDPQQIYFKDYLDVDKSAIPCPNQEFLQYIKIYDNVKQLADIIVWDMQGYLKQLCGFKHILEADVQQFIKTCEDEQFNYRRFQKHICEQIAIKDQIQQNIPEFISVSIFEIDNQQIIQNLTFRQSTLIQQMIQFVANKAKEEVELLINEYQKLHCTIRRIPTNIIELVEHKLYLEEGIISQLDYNLKQIDRVNDIFNILDDLLFILPSSVQKQKYNILSYPYLTQTIIQSEQEQLLQIKAQFQEDFMIELSQFKATIDYLEKSTINFNQSTSGEYKGDIQQQAGPIHENSHKIQQQLLACKRHSTVMNTKEQFFGMQITNFSRIDFIISQFEPLANLWAIINQWLSQHEQWITLELQLVDAPAIKSFVESSLQSLGTILIFCKNKKFWNLVALAEKYNQQIKDFLEQLPFLMALKEIGMQSRHWEQASNKFNQNITLQGKSLEDLSAMISNKADFIEISNQAKLEYRIELRMIQCITNYNNIKVTLHSDPIPIITNLTNMCDQLDDLLIEVQSLLGSQYNTPFVAEIEKLNQRMVNTQIQVEQLREFQSHYQNLYPVFQKQDLQKQLPQEINRFKAIERFWKGVTNQLHSNGKLSNFKTTEIAEQMQKLDSVQKSMANYLDRKREIFPRLCFLSNQQLLDIQSKSNQPNLFIDKLFLFDSVTMVNNTITHLNVGDMHLKIRPISLLNKDPEDWLQEVQNNMRHALQSYQQLQLPQCKLLVDQLEWTQILDGVIQEQPKQLYHQQVYEYLQAYPPDSFEWRMQMRYYNNQGIVQIKCLNQTFNYDYELLNDSTFIMHPQTDRCYVNIAYAIQNNFYCAISGASGKSETIRQFSRLVGKYYISINASILYHSLLTQMMKGVSTTGAYLCIQQFSLLTPELLSVMASHLRMLRQEYVELDGQIIKINPTYQVFLIHKQVSDLSTELRYLFRPIILQQPNLNIIITTLANRYRIDNVVIQKFIRFVEICVKQGLQQFSIKTLEQILMQCTNRQIKDVMYKLCNSQLVVDILNEIFTDEQLVQSQSIEQMMQIYNVVMVIGPSLSGKSTLINTLQPTHIVYYQSFDLEYYFGTCDNEGILNNILSTSNLVVFDGTLSEQIIEPLQQLFDTHQVIRFPNGQIIHPHVKCIFESDSMSMLAPSTVTKVGVVHTQCIPQYNVPEFAEWCLQLFDMVQTNMSKTYHIQLLLRLISQLNKNASSIDTVVTYAAAWAFGGHLSSEMRLILNKHIKERILAYRKEVTEFDNIFDTAFDNGTLVQLQNEYTLQAGNIVNIMERQRILNIQQYSPYIMYYGVTGSGKSTYLQDPIRVHMLLNAKQLKQQIEQRMIRCRSGIYRIGNLYIDDLHLSNDIVEFVRQLQNVNGWHGVKIADLSLVVTTQHIQYPQRLLNNFQIIHCEEYSSATIYNIIQQLGLKSELSQYLVDQYYILKQLLIPTALKPHYRIMLSNIMQLVKQCDCQSIESIQSGLISIIIPRLWEDRQIIYDALNINTRDIPFEPNNEIMYAFQKQGIIYYEQAAQIVQVLMNIFKSTQHVIVFGEPGNGRRTLTKLAASLINKTDLEILNEPTLEVISCNQLVNHTVVYILKLETFLKYSKIASFIYKLAMVYCASWPIAAYQQVGFHAFEAAYAIFKSPINKYNTKPIKYLQFTQIYYNEVNKQAKSIQDRIIKLQGGLNQLKTASQAVEEMNNQLMEMKPELEQAIIDVSEIVSQLKEDRSRGDVAKQQIMQDEQIAAVEEVRAAELQHQAKQGVERANIELEATLQEVSKLKKDHIVEVKSLVAPPKAVKVILGGVVILLQDWIKQRGEIVIIKKEEDYFETAKRYLLNDSKELMDLLKTYNRENIPHHIIVKLEHKILNDVDFTLERATQCSLAVKFLYCWVRAMYDFHKVYLETQPLRDALYASQEELRMRTQTLNQKKEELLAIKEQLDYYQRTVEEKQTQKSQVEQSIEECQVKVVRSQKLADGFREEQQRWTNQVYQLRGKETRNAGDCMIASAILAYGGPLNWESRDSYYTQIRQILHGCNIKYTEQCTLCSYFGMQDNLYSENNNILDRRKQVALLIDPQHQAIKYLNKMQLIPVKANDHKQISQLIKLKCEILIDVSEQLNNQYEYEYEYEYGNIIMITHQIVDELSDDIMQKYCVINYTITQGLLEEDILKIIVELENPSLEYSRTSNYNQLKMDQIKIQELEDVVLQQLSNQSTNELLDDETLVNQLYNSQRLFKEASDRIINCQQINEELTVLREQYRNLSQQITMMYFTLFRFSILNHMYQYSLQWFIQLLSQCVKQTPKNIQVALSVQNIKSSFLQIYLSNVGMYIKGNHYLLLCFQLSLAVLLRRQQISDIEIKLLLDTSVVTEISINPCSFIDDNDWQLIYSKLYRLDQLHGFTGISLQIFQNPQKFKSLYMDLILPQEYNMVTSIQRLLLIHAFRPDQLKNEIITLVESTLQIYYQEQSTTLDNISLNNTTPLLILNEAPLKYSFKVDSISLGIGQRTRAEKLLLNAISKGGYVELRNCHFDIPFVQSIESFIKLNTENQELHNEFRLILQTKPTKDFPVSQILKSFKVQFTKHHSILQSLHNQVREYSQTHQQYFFSLNLFHALCNQRTVFGLWDYEFHESDLHLGLHTNPKLILDFIYNYLHTQDQRVLQNIFDRTVCLQSLREGFIYMGGEIKMIQTDQLGYLRYFQDLRVINDYATCGLSPNMAVMIELKQANTLIALLAQTQQSKQLTRYDLDYQIHQLEKMLPLQLQDIDPQTRFYQVYISEQCKFNTLISQIQSDLLLLEQSKLGAYSNIEQLTSDITLNRVPRQWMQLSFESQKLLGSWMQELFDRVAFMRKWDSIKCYWLTAFYTPRNLIQYLKLNYAQYKKLPLESIHLQFKFMQEHYLEIETLPAEGIYVYGIRMQGARVMGNQLQALPKLQQISELPVMNIVPSANKVQLDYVCSLRDIMDIEFSCTTPDMLYLNGVHVQI